MATETGTAAGYLDLLDKLRLFASTNAALVSAGEQWAVKRWAGGNELILRWLGLSGEAATRWSATADPHSNLTRPRALLRGFVSDFYDRFHFSALHFDLGNITAGVSRVLTIWNAFLSARSLSISAQSGTAGVIVSGAAAAGAVVLRPLKVATTTFTITTDGARS